MNVTLVNAAKTLLINEKNEILILTRSEYEGRPDKSFTPDLPGGLVDPGETELVAAVREMQEEAGITLADEQFTLVYADTKYVEKKNKSVTQFLYIVRLDTTPEVILSWEHASYEWVATDRLKSEIELSGFYGEAVKHCFEIGLL